MKYGVTWWQAGDIVYQTDLIFYSRDEARAAALLLVDPAARPHPELIPYPVNLYNNIHESLATAHIEDELYCIEFCFLDERDPIWHSMEVNDRRTNNAPDGHDRHIRGRTLADIWGQP
jgi:hypothetical protein